MRKNIVGALIASAFALGGTAHAGLAFDLNGAAGGGGITADAFDWAPTSFLALGGNSAISNFANSTCGANGVACQFDVLTHAKLTAYAPTGGSGFTGLPAGFGEITMVARYTEQVIGFGGPAGFPTASFLSTGAGWLEFYYSAAADSADLTGSNFNNGRLIGRLNGVTAGSFGSFTVTGGLDANGLPNTFSLDGSADGNQYTGVAGNQLTVKGTGTQDTLNAGTISKDLDPTFFLTTLLGFSINYQNISIALPYITANPSDCFNPTQSVALVGTAGLTSTCDTTHVLGPYSAQNPLDPGYLPVVGAVNGLDLGSPDFVAQSDYNSSVQGVPEPGTLALLGLAVASAGFASSRRRRS